MKEIVLPDDQRWVHLILHTRGSWLHGDSRGFRSRGHRLHSSGDYKAPPPPGEHATTRNFHRARSREAIRLDRESQVAVLGVIPAKLRLLKVEPLAASVTPTHLHILASAPNGHAETNAVVAKLKQRMSYVCSSAIQRPIWAGGMGTKTVRTRDHQLATFRYIRDRQGSDALVWTFRDER